MNEIKNLSRKSARPAMIAIKNQKQTISLTTVSIEGGMYNKVLLRMCPRGSTKICYIYMYEKMKVI